MNDITVVIAGNISKENDYTKLDYILKFNKTFLSNFKNIIFIFNKNRNVSDNEYKICLDLIKLRYKKAIILTEVSNRGWQIGHIDLDRTVFNYIKHNLKSDFMLKFSGDILIEEEFLRVLSYNDDFLFLPSICIDDLNKGNYDKMEETTFSSKLIDYPPHPQTIFYMVSTKYDYIYQDMTIIDSIYETWLKNAHLKQSVYIGAEHSLLKSLVKQGGTKKCIIDKHYFKELCMKTQSLPIADGSMKNFWFKFGLCHLHWYGEKIYGI